MISVYSSSDTMAVCVNCNIVLRPTQQRHEYLAVDLGPELVVITEEWCGHEVGYLFLLFTHWWMLLPMPRFMPILSLFTLFCIFYYRLLLMISYAKSVCTL